MLVLLSPAKSLDETPTDPSSPHSLPRLLDDSSELVAELRKMGPDQLKSLMSISDKLAELNAERYQIWQADFAPDNAKQALRLFTGDVYQGMDFDSWDAKQWETAQAGLRILSGLYGLLRPNDLIMPYRLEMGTKLKTSRGKNLYEFWGSQLTDLINQDLKAGQHQWVCNLASNEYYSSVITKQLDKPVISPVFKDEKNGKFKIISFYAKKARGMMADFIVRNQISEPADLKGFDVAGYRYSDEESKDGQPTFLRPEAVLK